MPRTAPTIHDDREPPRVRPSAEWNGSAHGAVGEMHRTIEQRWSVDDQPLAVVALPTRPGEALIASASRLAGWTAFAATAALAARALF